MESKDDYPAEPRMAKQRTIEEVVDSGQMRLEAMGYKQVGILNRMGLLHAFRKYVKEAMAVGEIEYFNLS